MFTYIYKQSFPCHLVRTPMQEGTARPLHWAPFWNSKLEARVSPVFPTAPQPCMALFLWVPHFRRKPSWRGGLKYPRRTPIPHVEEVFESMRHLTDPEHPNLSLEQLKPPGEGIARRGPPLRI